MPSRKHFICCFGALCALSLLLLTLPPVYGFNDTVTDAPDSFEFALDLGLLTGAVEGPGQIGLTDRFDRYRFSLDTSRDVQIRVDDVTGPLYLFVLDSSDQLLGESKLPLAGDKVLQLSLNAGVYYIRLQGSTTTQTSYRLHAMSEAPGGLPSLPPPPVHEDVDAGNDITSSFDLGAMSDQVPVVISGGVGLDDRFDHYQFNLSSAGDLELLADDVTGPLYYSFDEWKIERISSIRIKTCRYGEDH